jgi:N-formylglutamate deformylase
MIAFNTFLGMKLFGDEIKESFILHIPHSSKEIPDYTGFNSNCIQLIENELLKLTDWDKVL